MTRRASSLYRPAAIIFKDSLLGELTQIGVNPEEKAG